MAVKVKDIYNLLDEKAPFTTQVSYDNAGLLVGNENAETDTVALCLDITLEAVQEAKNIGAQLIVSHHPIIFDPVKSIKSGTPLYELIKSGISAICAHTNLDAAIGGVNDTLIKLLKLSEISSLADPKEPGKPPVARMGILPFDNAISAKELAEFSVKVIGGCGARFYDSGKPIKKIAICGGAGGDLIEEAAKNGADAIVTADIRHHEILLAAGLSLTAIDCGHFATENIIIPVLKSWLSQRFPDLNIHILSQKDPLKYIILPGA